MLYRALTGAPPPTAPERLFDDQMIPAVSLPNSSNYRKNFLDGIDWALSINPVERPQNVADWRATLIDGKVRTRITQKLSPAPDLTAITTPVTLLGAQLRRQTEASAFLWLDRNGSAHRGWGRHPGDRA